MSEVISSKVCKKCGEEKIIEDFPIYSNKRKDGTKIFGRVGQCIECKKKQWKQWHEKNKDRFKETARNYYKKNLEKIRKYKKEWEEENSDRLKERRKNYYKENCEKLNERNKNWYERNKKLTLVYSNNYRKRNPEKKRETCKKWNQRNKDRCAQYSVNYRMKNSEKVKSEKKKKVKELNDCYIISNLSKKTGKNAEFLRQYPDLIESQKLIIKIHRLCKTSRS